MTEARQFAVSDTVVAREVGGEMMLMDLASGTYFGLDPIGKRMWEAIEGGQSLGAVLDALEAEFDVSRDQLQSDVDGLLRDLIDQKLIADAAGDPA